MIGKCRGNGCLHGHFSKMVLGGSVDGIFHKELCIIMIEHNIYDLTVNQNIISRCVEVMQILRLFSLRFMHIYTQFQL